MCIYETQPIKVTQNGGLSLLVEQTAVFMNNEVRGLISLIPHIKIITNTDNQSHALGVGTSSWWRQIKTLSLT
jgi:hypothetical protein